VLDVDDVRTVRVELVEVPALSFRVPDDLDEQASKTQIVARTEELLARRAAEFLGLAEVEHLLRVLEDMVPAVVRNVVPRPVAMPTLVDILRRLVEEQVSIRDLPAILEGLASIAVHEKDPLALVEHVRGALRRRIAHQLLGESRALHVATLDLHIEETIRRGIVRGPAGASLALSPNVARELVNAFENAFAPTPLPECTAIVMTQPEIRRFVRKLLESDAPRMTIVAVSELPPEVAIEPTVKVTVSSLR
jgi:type III secretion protein V